MRRKPYRVLLCGTNYGRIYLDPINKDPRCELAGILARGSSRSQDLARTCQVPFYSNVSQLPEGLDIACAALGSSAFDIVERLLGRGIHVLCEHPLKTSDLQRAHQAAQVAGVCFHLNGHFGDLEASRAFSSESRLLQDGQRPAFLTAILTDRLLYGFLDILCRSLGTLRPLRVEQRHELSQFTVLSGRVGGVESLLQIQRAGGPEKAVLRDGSQFYLIDLKITIGFPSGDLHLNSLVGPVLWSSNLNRRVDREEHLWKPVYPGNQPRAHLEDGRQQANCRALGALLDEIEGRGSPPEQHWDHLEEVVAAWEGVGRLLDAGAK